MTTLTTFHFQGDTLDVLPDGDRLWVSIRRVCDALGIAHEPQLAKLKDDPSICVTIIITQVPGDDQRRQIACIDLRSLPLWLATIHPSKVRPEVKEKLIAYKREAADVLADHFWGKRGSGADDALRAELSELRTLVYAMSCRQIEGPKPSIGPGAARTHILDPLKDIARVRAKAIGRTTPAAIQSLRASAERALRREVNFPPDRNMRWELFPVARLGDALCVLARMHGDAKELARIAAGPAKQTRLALVPA